ncbi:copper homeostasis membrane protein CopD [Pseudomonas yamanorum]|nr:copper homeostasis membrane protein CopD [Pseudomonas yamanorum]
MSESIIIVLRFGLYLDLMLLFGLGLFGLYGLRAPERLSGVVLHFKVLLLWMAVLGVLLSAASLWFMTRAMSGASEWEALWPHLHMMLWQTELGMAWMLRITALLVVALAVFANTAWPTLSLWLVSISSAVALATLAWAGHGAMSEGILGLWHLVSDISHLLAAGGWSGALVAFGLLLRRGQLQAARRIKVLARALTGFEWVGAVLVGVLIVTGIVNYLLIVGPSLDGMMSGTYGILLCLKLMLFALMLALAALNRFHLNPLLQRSLDAGQYTVASAAIRRSIAVEFGSVVLILGLVAWLGTLAPMVEG